MLLKYMHGKTEISGHSHAWGDSGQHLVHSQPSKIDQAMSLGNVNM